MSTETTPSPDDETRTHTTEPAEGATPGAAGETEDVRERPTDPAEGADDIA
jgi:hypothetical protein